MASPAKLRRSVSVRIRSRTALKMQAIGLVVVRADVVRDSVRVRLRGVRAGCTLLLRSVVGTVVPIC